MKTALGFGIQLTMSFFILFLYPLASTALGQDISNPSDFAYTCAPMKVWDAGYHLRIAFNSTAQQFIAEVSEVSFFGESPLFSEPLNFSVKSTATMGAHLYLFTQRTPSGTHFISFADLGHRHFKMKLILNGASVDAQFENLNCEIENWFLRQFPTG